MSRVTLGFQDGRCVGLTIHPVPCPQAMTVAQLVGLGVLSITDRMILDQIGQRVEKLAHQLDSGMENRG